MNKNGIKVGADSAKAVSAKILNFCLIAV